MTSSLSLPVSSLSSISLYPSAMLHSFFFSEGGSGCAIIDEDGIGRRLTSMIIFWRVFWVGQMVEEWVSIELPLGVGRRSQLLAGVAEDTDGILGQVWDKG